ncbi:MAG TPA: sialate O-acetylesterase [Bryobacteraceae bacterium]|jgi:hypothetical protein
MRSSLFALALLFAATLQAQEKHDLQLFLLIGQSNMAGRGAIEAQDREVIPQILMLNKDLAWVPAVDPLHFDKPAIAGVGLGRTFAKTLLKTNSTVTIGLIPAAFGGTSLDEWKPGDKLYADAIRRAKEAQKSGKLRGILWHQGEADAGAEEHVNTYRSRFANLVKHLREDLNAPDVPVVVGELGEFQKGKFTREMNEQLALIPFVVAHSAFASSAGLTDKGDSTHFNSPSARELGRRYALAFLSLDPTW